jgi:hypothetical protein
MLVDVTRVKGMVTALHTQALQQDVAAQTTSLQGNAMQ